MDVIFLELLVTRSFSFENDIIAKFCNMKFMSNMIFDLLSLKILMLI
jgi:hypothetical protein